VYGDELIWTHGFRDSNQSMLDEIGRIDLVHYTCVFSPGSGSHKPLKSFWAFIGLWKDHLVYVGGYGNDWDRMISMMDLKTGLWDRSISLKSMNGSSLHYDPEDQTGVVYGDQLFLFEKSTNIVVNLDTQKIENFEMMNMTTELDMHFAHPKYVKMCVLKGRIWGLVILKGSKHSTLFEFDPVKYTVDFIKIQGGEKLICGKGFGFHADERRNCLVVCGGTDPEVHLAYSTVYLIHIPSGDLCDKIWKVQCGSRGIDVAFHFDG
jgi:hypothetical protein